MKDFAALNLRNLAMGVGIALAIFFVIMTVVAVVDLYIDLRGIGDKGLEARASLVGGMIGAVLSGLLAVGAAFGAVTLERRHALDDELRRKISIGAPTIDWCTEIMRTIGFFLERVTGWLGTNGEHMKLPYRFEGSERIMKRLKINPKIQMTTEMAFPETIENFELLTQLMDHFSRIMEKAQGDLIEKFHRGENKWIASQILFEPLQQLDLIAHHAALLRSQADARPEHLRPPNPPLDMREALKNIQEEMWAEFERVERERALKKAAEN